MNNQRNRLAALFSLILFCFVAPAGLLAAEKLVILSPHWEGLRYELGRAFSQWHEQKYGTPVEFDWRDVGGTADDERFIASEFGQRPDGIGIDLFFGGGVDPYIRLSKFLQPYRAPENVLSAIPDHIGGVPIYDPEYRWYGTALSGFGILYNKRVLELQKLPVLKTWRELAEKAPVGSVGSGDPRNSGTVHMMYELILQRYGWDEGWQILALMAAKIRAFDRSSATTAKECSLGNASYALAVDFYALTQIQEAGKENMGFVMPEDCTIINPDALAILRGAPHLEVAQHFVEFAISETGQRLLMIPRGQPGGAQKFSIERMSILPALYDQYRDVTLVPINPFAQPLSFKYDSAKGGKRWDIVNALCGATLIDVQNELLAAYKRTGRVDGRPPISEQEALELAANSWRDPHVKQRKQLEWQRWAKAKYEAVASSDH